jgi:TonB-linked SusC/RagA family outer membrane protein
MQIDALCVCPWPRHTKKLLLLPFIALLMLMFSFSSHANTPYQNVTISFQKAPIIKIIKAIKKQTGVNFLYTRELLEKAGPIDIDVKNVSIEKALQICLEKTPLTYSILEGIVVIREKRAAPASTAASVETEKRIHGRVTDSTGKPLEGVSVSLKGSSTGTTTNANGEFEIVLPDDNAGTLVFSYVGMETREVKISGTTTVNLALFPTTEKQQEIVIIGYGSQKKVNLTGAVVSINSKQIENRAAADISGILTGQAPGLTVIQNGGNPGRNTGSLNIRGIGTLNNADPLIVVDGIPTGALTDINPEDVASVSVLKDAASASIYGVRAANGVILITTKRGNANRKSAINFSHQTGFTNFISLPKKASAEELAILHNQASANDGTPPIFTAEDIQKFRDGSSPLTHANTDLIGMLFSNGLWNSDNISFNGGSNKGAYNVSFGRIEEEGILKQTGLTKYTGRVNLDTRISNKLTAGLNLAATVNQIKDPAAGVNWITDIAFTEWANDAVQFPDGRWANPAWAGREHNAIAYNSAEMGKSKTHDVRLLATGFAEYQLFKTLKLKGIASILQDNNKTDLIINGVDLYRIDPASGEIADAPSSQNVNLQKQSPLVDKVSRDYFNNTEKNYQLLLTYNENFGRHTVTALAGYEQRQKTAEFSNLYRRVLLSPLLDQINAGDLTQDYAAGNAVEARLQSLFGRINYNFDERYLLEFNLRYDGSTKFAKDYRYDYFPSVSAGWRISKEKFFNIPFVSDLKIRGSWGKLGNQEVGDYNFIQTYALNGSYFFDGQEYAAITEGPLANATLTWEKTEAKNFGIDLGLFNNKLNISADYFTKDTRDILFLLEQPSILGAPAPLSNAAAVRNTGFEINADYQSRTGNVNYYIKANISKVNNEITNLAGSDRPGMRVGDPLQNYYGYQALGIFQSDEEVSSAPGQAALGNTPKAGDIRYADLTKDGKVDAEDRINLGKRFPGINYGFSLGADYKSFDISMVFQGVADSKIMGRGRFIRPFYLVASPMTYQLDAWTPDNSDARFPAVSFSNVSNYLESSFWMQSGAYLKMRNIQIGYTLPKSVADKLKITRARFYVSAENLFTITSFDYGFDPEDVSYSATDPVSLFNGTGSANYPTTKRILAGLSITF